MSFRHRMLRLGLDIGLATRDSSSMTEGILVSCWGDLISCRRDSCESFWLCIEFSLQELTEITGIFNLSWQLTRMISLRRTISHHLMLMTSRFSSFFLKRTRCKRNDDQRTDPRFDKILLLLGCQVKERDTLVLIFMEWVCFSLLLGLLFLSFDLVFGDALVVGNKWRKEKRFYSRLWYRWQQWQREILT